VRIAFFTLASFYMEPKCWKQGLGVEIVKGVDRNYLHYKFPGF
jgi:hypothetical protein